MNFLLCNSTVKSCMGCVCSRNSAAHEEDPPVNAPQQNRPGVQAPHHSDSSASCPGGSDADQLTSLSPDNTPEQNRSNARRWPSGASGPGGSDANQSTSLSPGNTFQQNCSNPKVHRRLPSGTSGPRDPDACVFEITFGQIIVHQETILLSPDFHCKISDFGLTRRVATDKEITLFHPNFATPTVWHVCHVCSTQLQWDAIKVTWMALKQCQQTSMLMVVFIMECVSNVSTHLVL
ncbi:hypothetical protein F5887DRAFT_1219270 [Amanita rubescens]|nr:hypothetical protein F5887DRAFT_1219270 [Amanita rubescens]